MTSSGHSLFRVWRSSARSSGSSSAITAVGEFTRAILLRSHLLEEVLVGFADAQSFLPMLEGHRQTAAKVARNSGDCICVDQRGSMNGPENGRVELRLKFLQGLADERLVRS